MKIVILNGQWLNHIPPVMRADLVRDIFSLAAQYGWEIRAK